MSDPTDVLDRFERLPTAERLLALERIIPMETVQEVLEETGHARRNCRRLPHWFMCFYVVGLSLFSKDSYRQVFKWLQRFIPGRTPGRNTFAEARKGLGVAPLRRLSAKVVHLLGTPETPGAFYKGMRTMSLDGFIFDIPDTEKNERTFGRPQSGRSPGAFPQVRVLGLCETGSHVMYRWLVKPISTGEVSMAPCLLRHLEADMLLLWDRGFLSYKNLQAVLKPRANLLARIKGNLVFVPTKVLPDGSYLSKMYPSPRHREKDEGGIEVRIIEYTLEGTGHAEEGKVHRLLTTLLDAEKHPAQELIILYHERWEEELTIDEIKTHEKERPVLRSQTPAGVIQEVEGLMLAHFVIRCLMHEAAQKEGIDPDRMSFTGTLKILRCRLPEAPKDVNDHAGRRRWFEDLLAEIAEEVIPARRHRVNPRVIKRKMSKWPKKRPCHRNPPKPRPFRDCIHVE